MAIVDPGPGSQDLARRHGLDVDPDARVWQLSVGEQQRVEIVKTLYRGARVLILDEPTAVLTPAEAQGLFQALRSLTREGHAVVFISHKLREVMEVSDRVVVLRGGRVVATRPTAATDPPELVRLMVGREVHEGVHYSRDPVRSEAVRRQGKTIGDFDLLIAATCLRHSLQV